MLRLHVGAFCLAQFQRILTDYVIPGNPLPVSPERWGDRLYKQAEINAWLERMLREMPNHPCLK